jgi:hypothetical protein
MKKNLILLITIIAILGIFFCSKKINEIFFDNQLLKIQNLSDIERKLGKPLYVFDEQGQFGKTMILTQEFTNGITINVYVINEMPPKFLVVKISKTGEVLTSIIEYS